MLKIYIHVMVFVWKILDFNQCKFWTMHDIVSVLVHTLGGGAVKECGFEQLVLLYIKNKYVEKFIRVKDCM